MICLGFRDTKDSLTPLVGGMLLVARGLGLMTGASDGWGGGVANCRSSRRTYVPSPAWNVYSGPSRVVRVFAVSRVVAIRPLLTGYRGGGGMALRKSNQWTTGDIRENQLTTWRMLPDDDQDCR